MSGASLREPGELRVWPPRHPREPSGWCGIASLARAATPWHHAAMTRPDPQTCEAKIEGVWRSISVAEAKGIYAVAPKRCPSCHGAVVLSGSYAENGRRKFSHRRAHNGCRLDPKRYSGAPAVHPQALT